MTTDIRISDPDPAWPDRAARLLAEIRAALGPAVVHAEHIGSTAIPGMAAKDVLDLQLSVVDLEATERDFMAPLAELGFGFKPYRGDHVPAGRDDSPQRWAKRFWSRREQSGDDANLHVRLVGSPNEAVALLFRDWFRAHPKAVPGYAVFKQTLARRLPDLEGYTDGKDPVVDLVIGIAADWARETGWQPHVGAQNGIHAD
jgi:GrpB-like predicted nucleotidyltransferase (UPF0157 family)